MTGRSNYPSRFAEGVTIGGINVDMQLPGEIFWVNNSTVLAKGGIGGSDGNKGTYKQPFSTIDKGITACKASRGDIVLVMPGHTETVSTTSINMDIAGVTVVCLGNAENQAVLTYNAAGSTITVSAANCRWVGGLHQSTILDCASAFTLSTATGFTLEGGKFEDT